MMKPKTLLHLLVLGALTVGLPSLGTHPGEKPAMSFPSATLTFALYRELAAKAPGNAVFSPAGARLCLGLALEGARGETRTEILTALGAKDEADARTACRPLLGRGKPLDCVNGATAQNGYPLHPAFISALKDHWQAKLGRQALGGATRLDLSNRMTFQGQWAQAFNDAKPMPFHTAPGKTRDLPMMHAPELWAHHAKADGCEALFLPFKDSTLGFLILLPSDPDGLADLEAGLTPWRLNGLMDGLAMTHAEVFLPKLDLRTDAMDLAPSLAALGVRKAFTPQADFSGVSPAARLDGLRLGTATQAATITLDEKGVKATSETHFVMVGCAATPHRPPPAVRFRADHPFMFFLMDGKSGEILFAGRKVE